MLQEVHKKIGIQLANTPMHYVRGLASDSASLWKLLAGLQSLLSIWLVQATQSNPSLTLLAIIVWGGAVVCIEDHLERLELRPSKSSLVAGLVLLLLATVRSCLVFDKESLVLILPLLQGIGLALLLRPIRQLLGWRQPLIVLSLFPLQDLAIRVLPDFWLSVVTAKLSQAFLLLFGMNAASSGRYVVLGGRGVAIMGACNSVDLIAQLTAIAVVFALAFPIRSRTWRIGFIATAPLLAMVVNAGRIAMLAMLNSSDLSYGKTLFTFLHDEWGALIFAGIATLILGQIYMILIDRELRGLHG